MAYVRRHLRDLMGGLIDATPESPSNEEIDEGTTLTLALPLRGHVQVRVAEVEPRTLTLVSLKGHPLAGAVRFLAEDRGADLRFEIQAYVRAAGAMDFLMMRTIGDTFEDAVWRDMVESVVQSTYCVAPSGVQIETEMLDDEQAGRIEEWVTDLVSERKRAEAGI